MWVAEWGIRWVVREFEGCEKKRRRREGEKKKQGFVEGEERRKRRKRRSRKGEEKKMVCHRGLLQISLLPRDFMPPFL